MNGTISRAAAAALLSLIVFIGPPDSVSAQQSGAGTYTIEAMQAATVQVRTQNAQGRYLGAGSGTIVSPDGLIVTNAHVTGSSPAHVAALYNAVSVLGEERPARIVVAMLESVDRPPVERYVAEVAAADGVLDLAVLRIVSTIDGDPVDDLDLPHLPIGDPGELRLGDELRVLGFPAAGGETITFTRGYVAGFEPQERVGVRAWIKTDATASPGNSGGLGADASGVLIGVPSFVREAAGGAINRLRSITLAEPLIRAARAGREYESPYEVVGSGSEQVRLDGWAAGLDGDGCATRTLASYPTGSRGVVGTFSWSGMRDGQPLVMLWFAGEELAAASVIEWTAGASGSCLPLGFSNPDGSPLPTGEYAIQILGGPTLETILATERVTVGGRGRVAGQAGTGVRLVGRVTDLDSGRAIAGATVYVLAPGVDPALWYRSRARDQVIATARTGRDGRYELARELGRGERYPLVVLADGYPGVGGLLDVGRDAPDPVTQNVSMPR